MDMGKELEDCLRALETDTQAFRAALRSIVPEGTCLDMAMKVLAECQLWARRGITGER